MEREKKLINNEFYHDLDETWHQGHNHPITLLRAENRVRNPWIEQEITQHFHNTVKILDIGCGGGLLTSYLAAAGHEVTGIDLSEKSLEVAKRKDHQGKIYYQKADASNLPFEDESFQVVSAMDLLEHVPDYQAVIKEGARVLKKGGLFFFHTFNRTIFSYLVVIKGVEWVVPNAPKNMHVYPLFIKPNELGACLESHGCQIQKLQGLSLEIRSKAFFRLLFKRKLLDDIAFKFSPSLKGGYVGIAQKL